MASKTIKKMFDAFDKAPLKPSRIYVGKSFMQDLGLDCNIVDIMFKEDEIAKKLFDKAAKELLEGE